MPSICTIYQSYSHIWMISKAYSMRLIRQLWRFHLLIVSHVTVVSAPHLITWVAFHSSATDIDIDFYSHNYYRFHFPLSDMSCQKQWKFLSFAEHTLQFVLNFLLVVYCNSYFGVCFWVSLGLYFFLAIWVTLAAVWKIIWHLYSRLIGIFYETRACWKQQT